MWDYTELIIEGVVICVVYCVIVSFLMIILKESWLQEYPDVVREKYLEMNPQMAEGELPESKSKKKRKWFFRLFIKKIIALCIYIIVMFAVAQTVEYSDIFITESFICSMIIWPVITLVEVLVLDIGLIANLKRVRLPGTESWDEEYRKVGKKALKDVLTGILFGVVVYMVLYGIAMGTLAIEIKKSEAELAKMEKELEELQQGSYTESDSESLDSYLNLNEWLETQEENEEPEHEQEVTELEEDYESLTEAGDELNEIADMFAEITENIHQVVEYKDENTSAENINDNRTIVRERPVFAGESLWSIAEDVYRNPYKWYDIYEANKDVIGENPARIYKDQYLVMPEDDSRDANDYEYIYWDVVQGTGDWEGITEYIDPDCGYEVQNAVFYYTLPEGNGEKFRISYPKLVSLNGKDVSAINAGIRERALINAEYMLINRSEDFEQRLQTDDRYSSEWTQDQVNYVITYLDENTISVVFQYYVFEGSIYAEYLELRSYVADINTGKRYKTTELLTNLEDGKVAEAVHEEIISFYEEEEKEFQTWAFNEFMTAELINETLQRNEVVEGRYYSNVFLTPDGVGIGFTYRMNKEVEGYSQILRGWKNVILPREQMKDYLTDAVVWEYTAISGDND